MIDLEKLFRPLRLARLKDHERAQMRASLIEFMRENPLKASAWRVFLSEMTVLTLSMRVHPLVTAFVLVLCVATGTSYAAENALPGEALYAVKTNVNEKAVGAFAVSHAAKVEWGAQLADRRLSEAEELVAEGKLTPSAAASIQSGLAEATRSFDDSVLAGTSEQSDTHISDAQSDMQASLQAHVHVLAALQNDSSADTAPVSELLRNVNDRVRGIAEGRSKSGKTMSKDQSDKLKDVIAAKRQDAEDAVKTLHELAASAKDSFGTTTADDVTTGALQAAERVTAGTKRLDDGDYSGALGSYQAAIRAAKETKLSLEAAKHVRKNLRSRRGNRVEDTTQTPPPAASAAKAVSAPVPEIAPAVVETAQQIVAPTPMLMTASQEDDSGRHGKDRHESDDSDDDSVRVDLHF